MIASIVLAPILAGLAITSDGARVYVTNQVDHTVSVIDTATNTVIATIPVGLFPVGIAITSDGARAYVTDQGRTISVINTATDSVIATIPASFLVN